jgi:hypothetical protein
MNSRKDPGTDAERSSKSRISGKEATAIAQEALKRPPIQLLASPDGAGHEWSFFAAMHVGFLTRWCGNMRSWPATLWQADVQ